MEQALEISNIKCENHMHLQCVHTCTVMYSCLIYLSVDMICIDKCLQPNPVLFVCMITCGKAYSQFSRGSEGVGGMGRGGAAGVLVARTNLSNLPL